MKDSTVKRGDTVIDFRGQHWTFVYVSRMPTASTTGRIVVTDEYGREREFYPAVFDLAIVNGELVR